MRGYGRRLRRGLRWWAGESFGECFGFFTLALFFCDTPTLYFFFSFLVCLQFGFNLCLFFEFFFQPYLFGIVFMFLV